MTDDCGCDPGSLRNHVQYLYVRISNYEMQALVTRNCLATLSMPRLLLDHQYVPMT